MLVLKNIIENTDYSDKILDLDRKMLTFIKPKSFAGEKNAEIKYDRDYSDMCIYLKKHAALDVETATVLDFFNAFEYVKKTIPKKKNG